MEKVAANHKYVGTEPLDLVKFICKEFWEEVFRKKVSSRSRAVLYLTFLRLTSCKRIIEVYLCCLICGSNGWKDIPLMI